MASEEDEFAIMFHEFYPSLCRFLECLLGGRGAAGVAQEIARVLGVSESKVKVDVFRARTALRERWGRREQAQARHSSKAAG